MKTLITAGCLAVLLTGIFLANHSVIPSAEIPKPVEKPDYGRTESIVDKVNENRIRDLVDDAFETGLKIGYSVAVVGGTKIDIAAIADSKRRNDPKFAEQWFAEHSPKH